MIPPERIRRGINRRIKWNFYKLNFFILRFLRKYKRTIHLIKPVHSSLHYFAKLFFFIPSLSQQKNLNTYIKGIRNTNEQVSLRRKYKNESLEFTKRVKVNFDPGSVYPSADDVVGFIHQKKSCYFLGVANMNSLNLLSQLDTRDVFLCDVNENQLKYLHFLLENIKSSENSSIFLAKIFNKSAADVSKIFESINNDEISYSEAEDMFWRLTGNNTVSSDPIGKFMFDYELEIQNSQVIGVKFNQLGQSVFGEIDILFSIFPKDCYFKNEQRPFSLITDSSSFLWDADRYHNLRKKIIDSKINLLPTSLSGELLVWFIEYCKYEYGYIWTSNILNRWFIDKVQDWPQIVNTILYYKYVEKNYQGLTILEDTRSSFFGKIETRFSPHWLSYYEVNQLLPRSEFVEIVSDKKKNSQKNMVNSKLMTPEEYLKDPDIERDTIFLHILKGHGVEDSLIQEILIKSKKENKKIIILEHNPESADFSDERYFSYNKSEMINLYKLILGDSKYFRHVEGKKDNKRNLILYYD